MTLDARELERGIALFERLVSEEPRLSSELASSARQYFRGPAPTDPEAPAAVSARRRHLEWFLFERVGAAAQERPAEQVLDTWRERAGEELAESSAAFLDSHASIFEVVEVQRGSGALLRDLAGLAEYPVFEPEASIVFEEGDLVVGRLFPTDGAHRISPGAGFFRNSELLAALRRDIGRLREDRRHPVLRIAQPELEAMFWGATAPGPSADPVGEARRFLSDSGLAGDRIEALLGALAAEPYDASSVVPGAGDRLGEVLSRIAFETAADLDRAREVLLAAWAALSTPAPSVPAAQVPAVPAGGRPVERVRRAIDAFDRDRASGLDLERSFERLERSLGIEGASELPDEPDEAVPDFPGAVAAVVEEFLWEVGRREGPAAARELEPLRALGEFGEHVGVLENLSARDLLTFAGFWLLERERLRSGREAIAMLAALRRFCIWAEEAQSLELLAGFGGDLDGLERNLPRVTEANLVLERGANGPAADAGSLLEFRAPGGAEGARVVDSEGEERRLRLAPELERHLEPGDRLRVRLRGSEAPAVLRVYPPEMARLAADVR